MKNKNIVTVLLIAFILASCAPAVKAVQTETSTLTSVFTLVPMATIMPMTEISSAKIIADYHRGLDTEGEIVIMNIADVAAKNLKIWVCTSQISDNWQQDIQGITSLIVGTDNLPLEFTQEYSYSNDCVPNSKNKDINIVLLKIESLPANHKILINIKTKPNIQKSERIYKGKVYIKTPIDLEPVMNFWRW